MKRQRLRTVIIIVAAILCASLIHASAASTQLLPWLDDQGFELPDWLRPHETTTQQEEPTTNPQDNTTLPPDDTTAPIVTATGTGTVPYTPPTAAPYDNNNYYTYQNPNTVPSLTTSPHLTEATSFRSSLSDLIERDSAAVVVSPVTAGYTLRPGSVVQEENRGGVTWQMAALIAAAVLFVILAALLIALYVQKRKIDRDGYGGSGPREYRPVRPVRSADGSLVPDREGTRTREPEYESDRRAPVYRGDPGDVDPIGTAEAIRAAAIADTLSGLDPLIRKYSDARADRFEDEENMTNEEILRATDDIIADIERQDRDREDVEARAEEMLGEGDVTCPACGAVNPKRCMFCRECGQCLR